MSNIAAILIAVSLVCLTADVRASEVAKESLLGTWNTLRPLKEGHAQEVFLADGTYCSFASPTAKAPFSIGAWRAEGEEVIGLNVSASENRKEITDASVEEIRRIRHTQNGLLMGYSCDHCHGGIAGAIYHRSPIKRANCVVKHEP